MSAKLIVAHGYLRDLIPEGIRLHVETVAEAIEALSVQIKRLRISARKGRHMVRVAGVETVEDLIPPTEMDEIHLVPAFSGGGGKGLGPLQIVIGVVAVGLAFWTAGGSFAALAAASSTSLTGILLNVGIAMILGGLVSLLSPAPPRSNFGQSEQDPEASKYLGAPKNTVRIGTRIPIAYGRNKLYGHYLSFNIDATQVPV